MAAPNPPFSYRRSVLLSPILAENQVFTDMVDAIDEVFYDLGIDPSIKSIKNIRLPTTIEDEVKTQAIITGNLIKSSDTTKQELETAILASNLLGFQFPQSDLFQQEDFLRVCESIAEYYIENKGLESWQNFLGFAFNAEFRVIPTWTEDYISFYPEGDAAIGTPVWEFGTWYPTTHVILQYDLNKFSGSNATIEDFFYTFANVALVLTAVQITQSAELKTQLSIAALITVIIE